MNKEIYLITTTGCEACKIMENILKQAQRDNTYTFYIRIINHEKTPDYIKKQINLTDFPTLIFIIDDIVVHYVIGTMNIVKVKHLISKLHFD